MKNIFIALLFFAIPFIGMSQEPATSKGEVFNIVETMPEFPGGNTEMFKFLKETLIYPPKAKMNNIQGKVYINFVVGKDGVIRDVKIIRGVHKLLDKEALRVVKLMPKWTPGVQRGKKVSVSFNLPINFRLKDR